MSESERPVMPGREVRWTRGPILQDTALLGAILDAYPAPSLVVDEDMRALFINNAARQALGIEARGATDHTLLKRGGHLLHCAHANERQEGCGHSPTCKTCVIRNSVVRAMASNTVTRTRAFLPVERLGATVEAHFLVSAAPLRQGDGQVIVLTLEDVSEIMKLTSLLRICFHCRKVRDEDEYWMTVEEYLKQKADVDVSHALCTECLERHYPIEER